MREKVAFFGIRASGYGKKLSLVTEHWNQCDTQSFLLSRAESFPTGKA
jgi:hypothetical protein